MSHARPARAVVTDSLPEETMTATEFLELSTTLVKDMQTWLAEAAADGTIGASDLEALRRATAVVQRVTVRETTVKAATEPESGTIVI
jgi:hypothetical protein